MALKAAILVLLVAAVAAVPLPSSSRWTQCRRSCPNSSLSKYHFQEGYTYKYEYKTMSSVEMSTLPTKKMEMLWTADVNLHFESPCEVTLEIESPRLDGKSNPEFSEQLTKWPLKAVLIDGTFEELCVDERESEQVLNVKRGILSSIQSSFPSNSTLNSGLEIVETDVLGVCPTMYKVEKENDKVTIEKFKDHRHCTQRFGGLSSTAFSGLLAKSPLKLIRSKSVCKQEIERGILKSVDCRDTNEFTLTLGLTSTKIAHQNSTLSLKKSERLSSNAKSVEKIRQSDLIYVPAISPYDKRQNEVLLSQLRGMCPQLRTTVTRDSARMLTDLITTMDRVEESFIEVALQKIKSGELCPEKQKLEDLFYDAVGSTTNGGAVSLMVKSLMKGERVIPFTWRLMTFAPVCTHAVEAVRDLIASDEVPLNVRMAAGTLVGRYCRNKGCYSNGPSVVRSLLQISESKIRESCKKSRDPKHKMLTISHLKTIGNIRNATVELQSTILDCFLEREAPISVRVHAAETLRQLSYNEKVVRKLIETVKTEEIDTEIRISAYKAAVLYANVSQISEIINITKNTKDINVYSFIASDLINLQKTEAPYKLDVRHRLSRFNISDYFLPTSKNFSKSFETSYFTETGALGGEISSEYIYKLNDFMPRQFRTNVTVDILKQIINLIEVGGRIENLPGLLKTAVRQNALFAEGTIGKIIKAMIEKMPESSESPEMEVFIKSFGKELLYFSASDLDSVEHSILRKLSEKIATLYYDIMMGESFNRVYGYSHNYELHVSTIQGLPLVLSHKLSAISQLNITHVTSNEAKRVKFSPIVAMEMTNYFGYKFISSVGIQANSTLFTNAQPDISFSHSSTSSSLKINTPFEKIDLVQLRNHVEVRKEIPGEKPYVLRDSPRDPRENISSCINLSGLLSICTKFDLPVFDIGPSDYPLVKPVTMNVTLIKKDSSMTGLELNLERRSSGFDLKYSVPGTQNEKKFQVSTDVRHVGNSSQFDISTEIMGRKHAVRVVAGSEIGEKSELFADVFYGMPQLQKVFTTHYLSSAKEFKIETKTLGPLQHVVHLDMQTDLSYDREKHVSPIKDVMYSFHVNKWELVAGIPSYVQIESYLRPTPKSPTLIQYDARTLISVMNERVLLSSTKSELSLVSDGFEMKNQISIEIWGKSAIGDSHITWTPNKKAFTAKLLDPRHERIFEVVLSDVISQPSRKWMVYVSVPKFDVDLRLSSQLNSRSATQSYVNVILLSKSVELISIQGPVSTIITEESVKHKSQIGIRMSSSSSPSTYHLWTDIDMNKSQEKYYSKVVLSQERQILLSFIEDVRLEAHSSSIESKLEIPSIILTELKWTKSTGSLQTSAAVVLKKISNRRIEGQLSMTLSESLEGQYTAKLFWDKINNPEKTLEFSGRYIGKKEPESFHLALRGDATMEREKYHYEVSQYIKYGSTMFIKQVSVEVANRDSQYLKLYNMVSIEHVDWVIKKMTSDFKLTTPFSREYELKKMLDVSQSTSAKLTYIVSFKCPKSHHNFDGSFDIMASVGHMENIVIELKSFAENTKPSSREDNMKMKSNGYLDISLGGYLNELLIDSNITTNGRNLEVKMSENMKAQESEISIKRDQQQVVRVLVKREGLKSLDAEIDLPSKSLSVSGKYDQREKFVRINTNRHRPSEKIELRFDDERSHEGRQVKLSLEYPHGSSQKSVVAKMSAERGELVGQLSLDVSSSSDALLIMVKGKRVDSGLYRIEAGVSSKKTSSGPMIITDFGYQRNLVLVESVYKPDSNASPIVLFSTKYVKVSPLGGPLSFRLNSNGKKMELGGFLSHQNDYNCQGYKLNGTVESFEGKIYGVEIVTCSPVFVKVITYNKETRDKYVVKAGLQSYSHAEFSLVKNSKIESSETWKKLSGSVEEPTEIPISSVSAKLVTPFTLALRSQLNCTTLKSAMDIYISKTSEIVRSTREVARYASRKLVSDIKRVSPELTEIVDTIARFITNLVGHEKLQMVLNYCCDCMVSFRSFIDDIYTYIKDTVEKFFEKFLKDILDDLLKTWHKIMEKLNTIINAVWQKIHDFIGPSKPVSELIEEWKNELENSDAMRRIQSWLNKTCSKFGSRCEYAKIIMRHSREALKKYFSDLYKFALDGKSIRYARSLVRRSVDMIDREEYLKLLQLGIMTISEQRVGVLLERNSLQVNLPLRRPVSNVLLAPKYIGYSSWERKYITIKGQQLTTLNLSVVKLPKSNCEYILLNDSYGTNISFKRAGYNDFTIKLNKLRYVSLEVPTKKVIVNGVEMKGNFRKDVVPYVLGVVRHGSKMVTTTEEVQWVSNIKDEINRFSILKNLYGYGKGVAWLKLNENMSESEILAAMEPYKLDKRCRS